MPTEHPYYRRRKPIAAYDSSKIDSNTDHIDLKDTHLPPYGDMNTVAEAASRFEARAAATVSAARGLGNGLSLFPSDRGENDLLEEKDYHGVVPNVLTPTTKCVAVLAYPDFFPGAHADAARSLVSQAILAANPGWCGSIGPVLHDAPTYAFVKSEGNYDLSEMHLLRIAYSYYDELLPEAQERLIRVLLATGCIHRVNEDDIVTSGRVPPDWSRAGYVSPLAIHTRIGETENHILNIHTARYLTNQLLYQRDRSPDHDNRRNHTDESPSCTDLMLALLRNILRDDFSEYNAKNYQNEVRGALLNLCDFAYDHEVRLGARMVLDYIAAHIAVSSNDLRRMIPFRRRNEDTHVTRTDEGYMKVGLLETTDGADPMAQRFAILAGNTRAYETSHIGIVPDWNIATFGENGNEAMADALSDYRLPPPIHDLFITDLHRRFFQRLHRTVQDDPEITGRNCDNHEIYAGSPSYLITAGGSPAEYAIDPRFLSFVAGDQAQQLGVAVPTSFMPTGTSGGPPYNALDLIQLGAFSDQVGNCLNYGVAPDFACGHQVHLPPWCLQGIVPQRRGKFDFVDKSGADGRPGFFLSLLRDGDMTVIEALDTWLYSKVKFEDFKSGVVDKNKDLSIAGLQSNVEAQYTTYNGSRIRFVIWNEVDGDHSRFGARVISIEYGSEPKDAIGDAGTATDQFLRGTVMNNRGQGIIDIDNHFLNKGITLDMSDQSHPKRTSESGAVEEAGSNHEVYVDFGWTGPEEGDFYRPFKTLAAGIAAVADGGVIRLLPGATKERLFVSRQKHIRFEAALGGVIIGSR